MNRFKRTGIAALLALVGAGLAGVAPAADGDVTAGTVVATVNGTPITLGHLLTLRAELPQQYQQLPDAVLFKAILDQVVQQTVLAGMLGEPTAKEQLVLDNQSHALAAGLVIQRMVAEPLSEEALQAAYTAKYADAAPETEYNAAHILVKTEEEANAIEDELKNGGDFAAIAREKSLDPGSAQNGGDLGWFGKGMMVPEFEAAVEAAKPGEITAPVQSQFGWHIIKLNETRLKDTPTLDDVRGDLTDELREETVQKAVDEAVAAATIDRSAGDALDPAVISKLDLLNR